MKKMAIVPFKMLEDMQRWKSEHRPRLPPPPQVTQTSHLQNEMQNVLQDHTLSESEKVQEYGQALQKFQLSLQKAKGQTPTSPPPTPPRTQTLTERIMQSVPQTMRRKAELLLHMLKDHPHMSWGDQGVLEYDGKPIQGSNIIDLVNDVLRNRKGSNPKGWEHFSRGLRDVNIPQEVVGNKKRWSWIQHPESDSDNEEFYDSFVEPPPIKQEPSTSKAQTWEPY